MGANEKLMKTIEKSMKTIEKSLSPSSSLSSSSKTSGFLLNWRAEGSKPRTCHAKREGSHRKNPMQPGKKNRKMKIMKIVKDTKENQWKTRETSVKQWKCEENAGKPIEKQGTSMKTLEKVKKVKGNPKKKNPQTKKNNSPNKSSPFKQHQVIFWSFNLGYYIPLDFHFFFYLAFSDATPPAVPEVSGCLRCPQAGPQDAQEVAHRRDGRHVHQQRAAA